MKKIITMAVLIFSSMLTYACTGGAEQKQAETQKTAQDGSVIVMNKAMFIKDIFDYEKSKEWKYKGDKPAIIDLYADWCGPCRMEMPNVVAAYAKYKAKGFGIVGVSLDNDVESWKKAIKDLNITWPQMSDLKGWQCEGAALYGVRAIPATLLVSKDGTIVARDLRGEDLEAKLAELMK